MPTTGSAPAYGETYRTKTRFPRRSKTSAEWLHFSSTRVCLRHMIPRRRIFSSENTNAVFKIYATHYTSAVRNGHQTSSQAFGPKHSLGGALKKWYFTLDKQGTRITCAFAAALEFLRTYNVTDSRVLEHREMGSTCTPRWTKVTCSIKASVYSTNDTNGRTSWSNVTCLLEVMRMCLRDYRAGSFVFRLLQVMQSAVGGLEKQKGTDQVMANFSTKGTKESRAHVARFIENAHRSK